MKISIIIAKRGRDKQLEACLHYLDQAYEADLRVCIVDDSPNIPPPKCNNFPVDWIPLPNAGLFNKSKLLNKGIGINQEADRIAIVDVDMIYRPGFINKIAKSDDITYIVSSGHHIPIQHAESIMETKPEISAVESMKSEAFCGPSQIVVSQKIIRLFKDTYGGQFYNEQFLGWGCEDSLVSFRSVELVRRKLIKKVILNNMWYHLDHPIAIKNYEQNLKLFEASIPKCFNYTCTRSSSPKP